MLRQRVITALIMAGLFLAGIVFLPATALAAVFALLILAGGWEWSRMAGWESSLSRAAFVALLAALLAMLYVHCQFADTPPRERVQPILGLACLWGVYAERGLFSLNLSLFFLLTLLIQCQDGVIIQAERGTTGHA